MFKEWVEQLVAGRRQANDAENQALFRLIERSALDPKWTFQDRLCFSMAWLRLYCLLKQEPSGTAPLQMRFMNIWNPWSGVQGATVDRVAALKTIARFDYYNGYLQTEHWLSIRRAALQRAGFACALCKSSVSLHVHHRSYDHLGEEHDADLIVLCADCHYKHHFGEKGP